MMRDPTCTHRPGEASRSRRSPLRGPRRGTWAGAHCSSVMYLPESSDVRYVQMRRCVTVWVAVAGQRAIIQHNAPFAVRIPDRTRTRAPRARRASAARRRAASTRPPRSARRRSRFDVRIVVRLKDVRDPVVVAQDGHHVHRLVGDVLVRLGPWRHDDVPVHRLLPDHPLQQRLALAYARGKNPPQWNASLLPQVARTAARLSKFAQADSTPTETTAACDCPLNRKFPMRYRNTMAKNSVAETSGSGELKARRLLVVPLVPFRRRGAPAPVLASCIVSFASSCLEDCGNQIFRRRMGQARGVAPSYAGLAPWRVRFYFER